MTVRGTTHDRARDLRPDPPRRGRGPAGAGAGGAGRPGGEPRPPGGRGGRLPRPLRARCSAQRCPGWPGRGWAALLPQVCRAPFLFGCWNPRHPNRRALLAALRDRSAPSGGALPEPRPDPLLEVCRRIAQRAAAGALPDPTLGATHWHDAAEMPGWAIGHVPTAEIGGLVFYRLPAASAG
ncbi:hypothetical protein ACFQY5_10635 [Paeniroseomonas aquatica]|uniref:hypothetical protein n=1 Tax=Paeniroseomonas aquatica TaxID=373043 RepID=UPI003621FB1D